MTNPWAALGESVPDRLWTPGFVLICIATFLFWNSVFYHLPLLPLFMKAQGMAEGAIGLVVGAGALAALVGRLLSGWAVDRLGTRAFLLAGALAWAATSPAMVAWPTFAGLLVLRLIQGAGLAVFTNASLGVVGYTTPVARRGAAFGWWGIANNLANATGPSAAGAILGGYGYGVAFGMAGVMGLLAALVGLQVPRAGGAGGRGAASLRDIRLYTPGALMPGLVGGTLGFAGGAFIAFAPLRAADVGVGAGWYLAVYGLTMIAARLTFAPLSDRRGRAWAVLPGMGMVTAAMGVIGFIADPALAFGVPALFGLGTGAALPGLLAWTLDRCGAAERATATSTFYSVYEVGLFLGATVLGQFLQRGSTAGYMAVAGILAAGLILYAAVILRARAVRGVTLKDG